MQHTYVATGLLLAVASVCAHAATTSITYRGSVSEVLTPSEAPGISVGDIVTFNATFDPSKAVDIGATFYNVDGATGLPVSVPGLKAISLSDDATSSYTVTIGSAYTFTEDSDYTFGHDFGLGAGNFPLVVYNGSQLLGIDGGGQAPNGLQFDFDPLAYMLHYRAAVGTGYADESAQAPSFRVTTDLDGAIIAAAAVPEPTTWALLLGGLAFVGCGLHRRRWRAEVAAYDSGPRLQ